MRQSINPPAGFRETPLPDRSEPASPSARRAPPPQADDSEYRMRMLDRPGFGPMRVLVLATLPLTLLIALAISFWA